MHDPVFICFEIIYFVHILSFQVIGKKKDYLISHEHNDNVHIYIYTSGDESYIGQCIYLKVYIFKKAREKVKVLGVR